MADLKGSNTDALALVDPVNKNLSESKHGVLVFHVQGGGGGRPARGDRGGVGDQPDGGSDGRRGGRPTGGDCGGLGGPLLAMTFSMHGRL